MYCPNCSLDYEKGEGFCSRCGWRLGDGMGEPQTDRKPMNPPEGTDRDKLAGAAYFIHWDLMHTSAKQFPVGRW
jgi:hypothetical protein